MKQIIREIKLEKETNDRLKAVQAVDVPGLLSVLDLIARRSEFHSPFYYLACLCDAEPREIHKLRVSVIMSNAAEFATELGAYIAPVWYFGDGAPINFCFARIIETTRIGA